MPILIHPDIQGKVDCKFICPENRHKYIDNIEVTPTSSGRTVFNEEYEFFIKLHYPFILGRFNRDIPLHKWLSSIEISRELDSQKENFPKYLSFLKEYSGIYIEQKCCSFGTLFRDFQPTPLKRSKNTLLIPAFSLFYKHGTSPPFLITLLSLTSADVPQLLSLFIKPILKSFIFLACDIGLIPEFNAQNVLFEYNIDENSTRLVIRDMMDFFKDMPIRKSKELNTSLCSYHSLFENDVDYYMRRSFAFDFKCSKYLIEPIVHCFCNSVNKNINSVMEYVKEISSSLWKNYPGYFKEKDKWYGYPKEISVNRKSYIGFNNPLLR